jgi:Homing endonuclease associated repeat
LSKLTYTNEQIEQSLLKAYSCCDGTLSIEKYRATKLKPDDRTIIHRYGSWSKALMECGIPYSNEQYSSQYSEEETIELLKKYYEINNGQLTYALYKERKYKPTHNSIRKKFGSWNNALERAGIPINKQNKSKYSKNELLESLKNASMGIGTISLKEYTNKISEPSSDTIISVFGSWSNALEEAGLSPKVTLYSDEEIILILKDFIENTGYVSESKYRSLRLTPAPDTIRKRFGSWHNAVKKAQETSD